jgi:hypothetical protein
MPSICNTSFTYGFFSHDFYYPREKKIELEIIRKEELRFDSVGLRDKFSRPLA